MRRLTSLTVVSLALAVLTNEAHAGGGLFVPPLRAELGSSVNAGPSGPYASTDMSVGVHWASLSPRRSAFDVGVGFTSSLGQDTYPQKVGPHATPRDQLAPITASGGYLELAARVRAGKHWRTWLGARGELATGERFGRQSSSVAASARLSTELFGGVAGGGGDGLVLGTFAIGLYVEAKYREYGDGAPGASSLGAGVSGRLPLILVAR
jgi:hypothetical protein